MTPRELAALHTRAMTNPWSEQAFADILAAPGTFLTVVAPPGGARGGRAPSHGATPEAAQNLGFALGRVILNEAELLTLAVDPDHQRQGLGRQCLTLFEDEARKLGATRLFLEVAGHNTAGRALYQSAGWTEDGLRKGYYRTENGRDDAILMAKTLKPA